MVKRKVKAKVKDPKWMFIQYATHQSFQAALIKRGTKVWTGVWLGNGFPYSVVRIPIEDHRYMTQLGSVEEGVAAYSRRLRQTSDKYWTKGAKAILKEAQQYVKANEGAV